MKISKKEIEHIAALARLYLSEEEKALYGSQLSSILDYMEKLNELDTITLPEMNTATIVGQAIYAHIAKPPAPGTYPGPAISNAWIALNYIPTGTCVYTAPCNPEDGTFTIFGVPPGT